MIAVYSDPATYKMDEDNVFKCMHDEAYIETACCPPGTRDCGCKGQDSVWCPNDDCTGITDKDIERIMG